MKAVARETGIMCFFQPTVLSGKMTANMRSMFTQTAMQTEPTLQEERMGIRKLTFCMRQNSLNPVSEAISGYTANSVCLHG
jgi:hypothetical protein